MFFHQWSGKQWFKLLRSVNLQREILQDLEDDWRAQIKQGLLRKMKYMQRKNKGTYAHM